MSAVEITQTSKVLISKVFFIITIIIFLQSRDVSSFIEKQTNLTTETSRVISESLGKFYSDIIQPYLLRMAETFTVLENAQNQLGIEEEKVCD